MPARISTAKDRHTKPLLRNLTSEAHSRANKCTDRLAHGSALCHGSQHSTCKPLHTSSISPEIINKPSFPTNFTIFTLLSCPFNQAPTNPT